MSRGFVWGVSFPGSFVRENFSGGSILHGEIFGVIVRDGSLDSSAELQVSRLVAVVI